MQTLTYKHTHLYIPIHTYKHKYTHRNVNNEYTYIACIIYTYIIIYFIVFPKCLQLQSHSARHRGGVHVPLLIVPLRRRHGLHEPDMWRWCRGWRDGCFYRVFGFTTTLLALGFKIGGKSGI